jgi:hypothetical protein
VLIDSSVWIYHFEQRGRYQRMVVRSVGHRDLILSDLID